MSRGPWIQTFSGRKFYLADPRPEDFCLEDIAHCTARINRFTGHGKSYSVAQHMVLASEMARIHYPDAPYLPARMIIHDAVEGYYGDVSSPLKSLLPGYRALESYAETQIEEAFGLTFLCDPLVKEVDKRMLLTERPLMFNSLVPWDDEWRAVEEELGPFPLTIEDEVDWEPWSPEEAEAEYKLAFSLCLPWVGKMWI